MRLDAAEVHRAVTWPRVLAQLGIAEEFLRNRPGPCPACGGRDRYRFDNRHLRGDFFCRKCGAGDGFGLLMRVHRWSFAEALRIVAETAGIVIADGVVTYPPSTKPPLAPSETRIAHPTARVRDLLRTSSRVDLVPDAVAYLERRGVWPVGETDLRAAPLADYYDGRNLMGRYPALVAPIRDRDGDLVSVHLTYLSGGEKAPVSSPRKVLSKLTGREGVSVRLAPVTDRMGVAEGIETALSAARLHDEPVWACLSTSLLVRFVPPDGIEHVTIYADRDDAGVDAAETLAGRLRERGVGVSLRLPRWEETADWNDVLLRRA